jgi:hypothetical protein
MGNVKCPKCGCVFEVARINKKGEGAHYSKKIITLSPLHNKIIEILHSCNAVTEDKAVPKRAIGQKLADMNIRVSGNVVSGRLSELLGMNKVGMLYKKIELYNRKTMMFRFRRTPVWYLKGVDTKIEEKK